MKTELTEILKKHTKEEWRTLPNGGRELVVITDYDGAFKEHFDQQTEQLKKELSELKDLFKKECELRDNLSNDYDELSSLHIELKAKHKECFDALIGLYNSCNPEDVTENKTFKGVDLGKYYVGSVGIPSTESIHKAFKVIINGQ